MKARRIAERLPVIVPVAVAVALVPWILVCARTYPLHPLQFDHSIYQYMGWAIRHGDRLYRDVATPDGPLITWLHAVVQIFAGESDAGFRWADLVIQVAGAAAIGWVFASRRHRIAWATAIAALWLAQYFRYDWLWTAQREAYYALAGYLGMGLLVLASRRRGRAMVALSIAGGFLVGTQLFGKPVGVIFIALGVIPALFGPRPRLRRIGWMFAGVGLAIAVCVALLALTGSLGGFWFWYVRVPPLYRYLMGSSEPWRLFTYLDLHTTILAGITLVAGGVALWRRAIPRGLIGFFVAPALFLVAMILQRKGYTYQAHPVTAGAYLALAILAIELIRRRLALAGALVMLLTTVDATRELAHSWWIDPDIPSADKQWGAPHDNNADLFAMAAKLAAATGPDDRVFAYGPAGKILFEAGRKSAIAPFTNYFFNVQRALKVEVSDTVRTQVANLQKSIAHRYCPRLVAEHPAAVLVCDGSYWSDGPGLADATEVCSQLAYVTTEYREVDHRGCWRLYLRVR